MVGKLTDFAAGPKSLVVCADDAGAHEVASRVRSQGGTQVVSFSESAGDEVRLLSAMLSPAGSMVTVLDVDRARVSWTVPTPGRPAVLASLAAYSAGRVLGERPESLTAGLSGFQGVRCRMQMVGERQGMRVVDSFAHHPTAIASSTVRTCTACCRVRSRSTTGPSLAAVSPTNWTGPHLAGEY